MKPIVNMLVSLLTKYVISIDRELVTEIVAAAAEGAVKGAKK